VASTLARDEKRTLLALWGGMLVPPAAWSLHLLLGYLLVTLGCLANWSPLGLDLLLQGLTLLLAAVTVASAVVAWRAGHAAAAPGETANASERRAFMAHAGIFLSALFLLLILAGDVPNLFVPPCGSGALAPERSPLSASLPPLALSSAGPVYREPGGSRHAVGAAGGSRRVPTSTGAGSRERRAHRGSGGA
jgi:hypothetical protein